MLVKIDGRLLKLARWLILAATFFGISRKRLIYWWGTVGVLFHFFPNNQHADNWPILITLGSLMTLLFRLFLLELVVSSMYREDDILSNHHLIADRRRRIRFLISSTFWSVVSGTLCLSSKKGVDWIILFKLINLGFIPWFCLQNPTCKTTCYSWLKGLTEKTKKAMLPKPNPLPQPTSLITPEWKGHDQLLLVLGTPALAICIVGYITMFVSEFANFRWSWRNQRQFLPPILSRPTGPPRIIGCGPSSYS